MVNIDTLAFRKWLMDYDVLDQSIRLFWTHFKEQLCTEWTQELRLSSPLKEEYLSLDFYEACLKIEDIGVLRKANPSEYIEVRLNVFFKGSFIAYFKVHFDLLGKWIGFEPCLSMITRTIREDVIALESLKEMFEKENTAEAYSLETRATLINIIDRKIRTIKDAFE